MAEIHLLPPLDDDDPFGPPRKAATAKTQLPAPSSSKGPWKPKVEGVSALIELLCEMISKRQTENPRFSWGLRASGFNQEQLWKIYEDWSHGKLHPLLVKETK